MLYDSFRNKPILEKQTTSGAFAWLSLALLILAYDIYAIKSRKIETLTKTFWRLTEKQTNKIMLFGAWLVLTFHLLIEKPLRKSFGRGV